MRMGSSLTIPKIIHICWFGDAPIGASVQACLKSIYALEQRGYEIRLWNEKTYDVHKSNLISAAYRAKRWSLVSNYVRLDVLVEHGGIYLDTDVEVVGDFDALLDNEFFLGFMWDCTLGTAVIGAVPGHAIPSSILRAYDDDPTTLRSPNNNTFTDYFIGHVKPFKLNGRSQSFDGVKILDKFAFEQPSFFLRKNYSVHKFEQSWIKHFRLKRFIRNIVISTFSLWLYRKYVCWNSLRISPYYGRYLDAVRQKG